MAPRPWWLKAGVQGALSLLPQPQRWNRLLQRYVTRSIYLREATFARKWAQARDHLDNFARCRDGVPSSALELGTGWHPIVPVGLALLGVPRVFTVDITSMVSGRTLGETLQAYARLLDDPAIAETASAQRAALVRELVASPMDDPAAALARLGVTTMVADARSTGLQPESVALFVSNNTLEHVPEDVIVRVFGEYKRIATSDAVMSHYIDMKDHYSAFDKSITVYNFLRFSDTTWRVFNNDLQYQNRLRLNDFRRLHAQSGWTVRHEDNDADEVAFDGTALSPRFRRIPREDCMVHSSWLVSELAATGS